MKNWSDAKNSLGECSWKDERKMAIRIASMLNIPLITIDSEKQYKRQVVEKMFQDYRKGITPNPDIDCNQKIKFPVYTCGYGRDQINLPHVTNSEITALAKAVYKLYSKINIRKA